MGEHTEAERAAIIKRYHSQQWDIDELALEHHDLTLALAACREELAASEKRASEANERAAEMMRMADHELCDCENTLPSGSLCGWCKTTSDLRMTLATSDLRARYTALHRAASALMDHYGNAPILYPPESPPGAKWIARRNELVIALSALLTEPAGGSETNRVTAGDLLKVAIEERDDLYELLESIPVETQERLGILNKWRAILDRRCGPIPTTPKEPEP